MNCAITSRRRQRGFAMVLVLGIIVLLLIAGLAMLANASGVSSAALNSEQKNESFNSAEAGLNDGLEALDNNALATGGPINGNLPNNATYSYTIFNNLAGGGPLNITDPVTNQPASVPPGRALVYATGTGTLGVRSVQVEALVQQASTTFTLGTKAIMAELDIAGNTNPKTGISESSPGKNDSDVHANGNITAKIGFIQGAATAAGNTNTFDGSPGHTGQDRIPLPTAQIGGFAATEKAIAQSGGFNLYIPNGGDLPNNFVCPPPAGPNGCVVFVDGSIHMSGQSSATFNGTVTLVINGDYTATGQAGISFDSGSKSLMSVMGASDFGGNGFGHALLWSKGDVTLHGNGNFLGAIISGGNVVFKGGGSGGGFQYDDSLKGITINTPGRITVLTYGEF